MQKRFLVIFLVVLKKKIIKIKSGISSKNSSYEKKSFRILLLILLLFKYNYYSYFTPIEKYEKMIINKTIIVFKNKNKIAM